jgi:hypothetical protein
MGMDSLIDVASRTAWLELAAADCSVPVPLLIERHRITANSIAASTHPHPRFFLLFAAVEVSLFAGKKSHRSAGVHEISDAETDPGRDPIRINLVLV